MCGISGFNWKDEVVVKTMTTALSHRGPDATGIFCDEGISLGHNRLSIIDLSPSANQPMFDNSNNFAIVFNGEIYNFEELKKELPEYSFKTKSDTEVILAGYKKWGKGVVERLNGMFAFAIWDKTKKELFIARDRAGIKPLYYFWDGKRLIFASEVKAILMHDVPRILDCEAFNYYMRALYVPAPLTMIKGIRKLPVGGTLTLQGKNFEIGSYKKQETTPTDLSYGKAKKILREKAIDAVKRQLVSDVPVGVYLSGGIDSSVIFFAMTKFQKNIKTFSVGFELGENEEKEKFNRDFELAKQTADFFGVEHHQLVMSGDDVVGTFGEMIKQNDDPISNPTAIAMMYLAKNTKKEVTVVLSGNGGDELFGGYERYRLALISSYYKKIPKVLRMLGNLHPTLRKFDEEDTDLFARFMFEKDKKLSRIISKKIFKDDSFVKKWFRDKYISSTHGDVVARFMQTDRESWLPDQALALSDKMSMRFGVEERVPLLDNELVDFANSLPTAYKVTAFQTKKIFKDAFRNDLPDILFNQPKRGFFAPGAKWLRNPRVSAMAREILSENYHEGTKDLFDWKELNQELEDHISKKEYNLTVLWSVMTLRAWAKEYKISL